MTLSTIDTSSNPKPTRQYIPAIGKQVKLRLWEQYRVVAMQHSAHDLGAWAWFTVRYIVDDSVNVEHYNAGDTGVRYFVPLAWIAPPIGWEPRYTIHCKPEDTNKVLGWFARGIVVRQSHDMSGSMPTAFQPLTDGDVPGSPHWQFCEVTDVIPAEDCPRLFRVIQVEREEITSATLGYPADPKCGSCQGTGRRTIAQLAEVRKETIEDTWRLVDAGTITLDDLQSQGHHSAFDTFRCHCHFGALSRIGRTSRGKLFKAMRSEGWTVKYIPYAGGYWERTRETIVHDWQ